MSHKSLSYSRGSEGFSPEDGLARWQVYVDRVDAVIGVFAIMAGLLGVEAYIVES